MDKGQIGTTMSITPSASVEVTRKYGSKSMGLIVGWLPDVIGNSV